MGIHFISRPMGRAWHLSFFLGGAGSLLLAVQVPALDGGDALSSTAAPATTESLRDNAAKADNSKALDGSTNSTASEVANVKTYGAVGDGVTNDTAAFIKALAACAVDGGTCLVPEGTYLISGSGISTGRHRPSVLSGVHLKGAGRRRSVLKIAGMPTDHFLHAKETIGAWKT